jgi:NADPH-dependent 2,4-dienoyl-CoA reductase/sulfur reductase-like enzyme
VAHLVVVGGSDAGISAALRARELAPDIDVTVVVADAFPNFSICGIPYYISRQVPHWTDLAHRTLTDLQAAGLNLLLDTKATRIDVPDRRLTVRDSDGHDTQITYDALVVGTGAVPVRPQIPGLNGPEALGPQDGVHVLHTMTDTFELTATLERLDAGSGELPGGRGGAGRQPPARALIVGAGYVGLEMAEALVARGLHVIQVERLPEVLPTLDPDLGALVHAELERHGVDVVTDTAITAVQKVPEDAPQRIEVTGAGPDGTTRLWQVDLLLVVVGVQPDTELLTTAGAATADRGAVAVDQSMATGLPQVWAAGDCVVTHHRMLATTYLPLGTTAHKQGRVAGQNAVATLTAHTHRPTAPAVFAGSLGTQVVKIFDLVAARTGLKDREAAAVGHHPLTTPSTVDDHKAYYPGAHPIAIRVTADTRTGQLLGAQLVGQLGTEIAKRVDIYATALFHQMTVDTISDLDLSYTPPLGSPWDAVQTAAQNWHQHATNTD